MSRGCLTSELRAAEYVAEEVVVVEAPHPVAPGGLELVDILQPPAEAHVAREEGEHDLALDGGLRREEAHERKAEQEERERRLVARAVVHAHERAERRQPVRLEERNRRAERLREQCAQERRRFLRQTKPS